MKGTIELLLTLVILMMNQLGLNSQNSCKPPSTDPNRKKKKKKAGDRKAGKQKGHTGTTLQKFDEPDHIEGIPVDRKSIPKGKYKGVGYESRQIVDIEISRIVTEYRAQILEDANGKRVWLHCVSNDLWSYYRPHERRGLEAMEEMGVMP